MLVSIIVCTVRRTDLISKLMDCIAAQTYANIETLIIDAGESRVSGGGDVKVIRARKGLTHQRNVGLNHAKGDVICFFDDDVTFGKTFVSQVVSLLQEPSMRDVGGLTGYDVVNYPSPVTLRWRLRALLRTIPSLQPGDADHLGRTAPHSFLKPFRGCREVKWLPGFCQIYRREAIGNFLYDEKLSTYAGEDKDFSLQVGKRWRLVLCGDLDLAHHRDLQARASEARWFWESGFGAGRSFAKRRRNMSDLVTIAWSMSGELVVDLLAAARRPCLTSLKIPFSRQRGLFAGLASDLRQVSKPDSGT
jgi:glycosyltransferase involved in cell wall biosynthesis